MVVRTPLPVTVQIDGRPTASETLVTSVGPWCVVVETAIADPGCPVSVQSTFIGCRDATATQVTRLLVVEHGARTMRQTRQRHKVPVWMARERGVIDHLEHLQARLAGPTAAETFGARRTLSSSARSGGGTSRRPRRPYRPPPPDYSARELQACGTHRGRVVPGVSKR